MALALINPKEDRRAGAKKSSSYDVEKQVKNYEKRLGSAKDEATDDRNWLEKALNLGQNQGLIKDIFEILNRPQNAIFSGISSAQKGEGFGAGFKKGITGEKRTEGKELLTNAGMKDREGKLDLSDILGFGLDIFADPMDLAVIPVKAVSSGAKAARAADVAKAANTLSDASRVVKGADDISDTVRGLKLAGNIGDTLGKGAKIADNAEQITKAAEKATRLISPNQAVFSLAGKAVKGAAKTTDKGLEKVLGALDSSAANKIQKLVDQGYDLSEAQRLVGKSTSKLQTYQDIKKGAKKLFDSSKNLKGLVGKGREAENIKDVEKYFGTKTLQEIRDTASNIAKKQGGDYEKVYAEIMDKLSDAVEANADWSLKGSDIVKKFKASKTADFFTPEQAEKVQKVLDNFGIKSTLNGRKLVLDAQKDAKKISKISGAILDEKTGTKFADTIFGKKMTDETFKELNAAKEFFEKDEDLAELYNKVKDATANQAKVSGALRGINPENITTEGYLRHVLNEDVARSKVKAFDSRQFDAPLREINKLKKAEFEEKIINTKEGIEKLQRQIYKSDANGRLILDKAGKPIRDDNLYNALVSGKENFINNMQKQLDSYKEIVKKGKGLDIDVTKLSKKGEKAIGTIDSINKMKDDLDNIVNEIGKIDFKKISPENMGAIKNVLDDYNEYTKKITALKNYAAKGNVDEVGGLLKRKDQVKGMFENIQNSKKKLTASMTEARAMADTTNKTLIKEANKSAKVTFKEGQKYAKLESRFKDTSEKISQIYQNANDMVDSLTKRINFEKASLDKLKGAGADAIFNQKVNRINDLSEAVNVLSDKASKDFFKTAFDMNFADYIKANSEFTTGAQKFNDALISGIFNDKEFVKTAEDLVDGKIPYGFEKIDGSYLAKKLSKYEGILSDGGKRFIKDITQYSGKSIYVDKQLVNMLDVGTKVVANEVSPLLKLWDGINNTFKKFATLTPGFQMRNIIGNSTDMVLSGMPSASLPTYWKRATDLLNNYDDLAQKAINGTLDAAEKGKWDSLLDFYKAGFDSAYAKVQNLDTLALKSKKNPIDWVSQKSMDMNESMDRLNRMSLYLYAKDHPKYLMKVGAKNATDAVRKVLFDPSNMSEFETKFAKRVIPFYTFTKQNLMFQMNNMMRNTPRYNRLFKSLDKLYDNLDENQYFAYQREGMQIPLPWKDDKGNQMFLKSNLPMSDLGEFLSNPIQRTLASTAPLIKTPIELATGKDLYTGQDSYKKTANDFANAISGKDLSASTQKWTAKAEQILSGMGLANITTNNVKKVSAILKRHKGDMDSQAMWAEIFRSMLQNTNQEKVAKAKAYENLELYKAYVKQLKNQGIDVPTIREINANHKKALAREKLRRSWRK